MTLTEIAEELESIANSTGEARLQELAVALRSYDESPPNTVIGSVTGVSFVLGYPENLLDLAEVIRDHPEGLRASLERDPMNEHDYNAVKILVNGSMIGHLPRGLAATVSPLIRDGLDYDVTITGIRVSDAAPRNPGADFRLDWVTTDEKVASAEKRTATSGLSWDDIGNDKKKPTSQRDSSGRTRAQAMANPRQTFAVRDKVKQQAEDHRRAPVATEPPQTYRDPNGKELPF